MIYTNVHVIIGISCVNTISYAVELDRKLLLMIIKEAGIKINNAKIATLMTTEDEVFTVRAIEGRMSKLKNMIKAYTEGGAAAAQ